MAYRRIVLATDGSDSAETPEHVAMTLAKATKGRVTVVNAYRNPERAEPAVRRAREIGEREGVKTEVVLSPEEPDRAIVATAEDKQADVIVIGSRGLYKGEQLVGNVVRKVATHAPCDVLLTRERAAERRPHGEPPYRRLLIASDGSATADRAARKGYALAKRLGASVTLLFVGHPTTGEMVLQDTIATIGDQEVPSSILIRDGDAAQVIIDTASSEGFDLVVVGNRGLAGAKAMILGSVPRSVTEYATCDVLVARTIAQSLDEIGRGEGGIVTTGDHKVAVYRDERGHLTTLSAKCTHMGCTVKWNPTERTWDCPCHGSRFSGVGEVVNGPAARPLDPTTP
jgi:nucleotide-binding universal stress UspA family protein